MIGRFLRGPRADESLVPQSEHYGHGAILRAFAGVPANALLTAFVQHGWTFGPVFREETWATPWPKLLWARRNVEHCRESGRTRFLAIGAPFLYLPPTDETLPTDRSLLAMPFHGWEREPIEDVEAKYAEYAEHLSFLAREGFSPITVCLYWFEHQDPRLRRVFEERGFSVVTNGRREDARFLETQRSHMLRNRYVTSNRIATAVFYGLSLGRICFLTGPTMGLKDAIDVGGARFAERQREEFGELAYERFTDAPRREIGERELGLEYKLSPEALREILGWSSTSGWLIWQRRMEARLWSRRRQARAFLRRARDLVTQRGPSS